MQSKLFEVVDSATNIPVLATKYEPTTPQELYLLNRAGLGKGSGYTVQLTDLGNFKTERSKYNWTSDRTMTNAQQYIERHWDELETGDLIDIQYILGETDQPKKTANKDSQQTRRGA